MTITPTSIGLSWIAPVSGGAPTYGYTVVSRQTGSGPFSIVAAGLAGTSYEVTGLAPSTSYDFATFAVNGAGPGPMSGIVTQSTLGAVPNPPTGLTASAGSPAYSAVALSWTAPAGDSTNGPASTYIVQYALHGTGIWTTAASGLTATNYTLTGLAHTTSYDFQVIGVNNAGSSPASSTVTLATTAAAPNMPTAVMLGTLTQITTSSIQLSWTASTTDAAHDAPTSYTLQYSVHNAGSWTQITGITGTSETVARLSAGTSYDFEVEAVNAGGSSVYTSAVTGSTYPNSVTMNSAPPSSFTHGSGPGFNVAISPNTNDTNTQAAWSSSSTVAPTSGWAAGTNYSGDLWAWYLSGGASSSPGTVYLWVESLNSSNVLTGLLVSGPYTVT